ncbi:MlaD family protein [Dysgonomonas macrotermitis]|uniref:Phospholipid/cholesterol/gamma-HCH transport system substrate-binding protein n=1 Tax=Dysgonomonas macrotermitis TaxID=1346286 RepID=A0A1M4ZPX0_9BACT|nr:MlaD family protein [Dysgonomonas macrotermitis]SHF20083.1 phospholipid/cholesterol/gamma-HCH transport system substrate-binding protein [Dysgonomonas macrotermitis]
MKKVFSKEVKIGIGFLVALFLLYAGINFLKGINIFKPANSFTVVFDDVTGLALSTPVSLNGYQVGLVYSMELDEKEDSKVLVVLNLDKGVKIPKGSKIKLDVSLMGNATVIIDKNPESQEYYSSDDRIPGTRQLGMMESMSQEVLPQVGNLVPKIDSILMAVQLLVSSPALVQSLDNMTVITTELTTASKQLNQMMSLMNRDLPKLSNNMTTVTSDLAQVSGQFKAMDFQKSYQSIDSTLKNMELLTTKLNSKDNSVGLLMNDRQLYDSLVSTMSNASLLLKDVKENPSRYINVKVF